MHRFVWPLRYRGARGAGGRTPGADGVWAPPGRYTVVLEVDGARLTQPLTVAPDPRVTLPPEAYAAQFELARRIEAARARLAAAAREIGSAGRGARRAAQGRGPASRARPSTRCRTRRAIAGAPPPGRGGCPRTLTSLRAVGGALDELATAVDGADAAPSPDAVTGFEKAQPALDATLAAWEALKAKDLAALDAR